MTSRYVPTSVRPGYWWLAPAVVLLVATAVAQWSTAPYTVGVFHDDGVYALLARALATGQGFHYTSLVNDPAAVHYPPLYPLLLSIVWRIAPAFPQNVSLLVGINAPLAGAAAVGWWYFATRRGEWRTGSAAAGALVSTLTLPTLALVGALLSETLFLALLWPVLLLSESAAESNRTRDVVIAGAAIGVLMLIRTHGVALLLALLLLLVFRRHWRNASVLIAAALLVQLPWLLWSALASPRVPAPLEGAYGSYLGWFARGLREGGVAFAFETVRVNARECWLFFQDRLAAGFPSPMHALALALTAAAFIAGAVSLHRRAPVTAAFIALYLAIVLVWPYNPWRFVWGVWPLLILVVLSGFRAVWQRGGQWRVAACAAALLPAVAMFRVELHAYASRGWRTPAKSASAQFAPIVSWVRSHAAADDVVLSEGEPIVTLFSGQRAAPPISFTAREYVTPASVHEGATRLAEMIAAVPARYVILLNPVMQQSALALASARPGLRQIDQLPMARVYEVVR